MVVAVHEFEGEEIWSTAQKVTLTPTPQVDQDKPGSGVLMQGRRSTQQPRTWSLEWTDASDATVALVMNHYDSARFHKIRFNRLTGGSSGPVVQYAASPQVNWGEQKTAAISLQLKEAMG